VDLRLAATVSQFDYGVVRIRGWDGYGRNA
jgi:hypothetical protein